MDEIEHRLAALELLAIERLALESGEVLAELHRVIAEGLEADIDADERVIREQALQLLEDAARRRQTFIGAPASPPARNDP